MSKRDLVLRAVFLGGLAWAGGSPTVVQAQGGGCTWGDFGNCLSFCFNQCQGQDFCCHAEYNQEFSACICSVICNCS